MESPKFFSVRAAATALNVSPETVRSWCTRFGFGIKPTPTAQWRIPASRLEQLGLADDLAQHSGGSL